MSSAKPATQPRHSLNVRHEPCAEAEDEDNQDDEVVPVAVDAVTERDVGEAVELQDWVVGNEIDHRVLTYVANDGHSPQGQFEEQSREADEEDGCVEKCCPTVACEAVGAHHIFAMPQNVEHDECHYQCGRNCQRSISAHLVYRPAPCAAEVKEKDSHEHVVETHGQRVVESPHPVTDKRTGYYHCRLQHRYWFYDMDFLDEMHQDVCDKEGKQKPDRLIAPKRTRLPQVTPLHRLYGMMEAVNLERKVDGIDDETNSPPCQIWHKQPLRLVLYVCLRVARNGLVEIACLKEKEAHEEERPCHDLLPPSVALMTAERDGVQANHADDADAAQEVESVIAFPHLRMSFSVRNEEKSGQR